MKHNRIFFICFLITAIVLFNITVFAYSGTPSGAISNTAENPEKQSSEIVLSIDVTERYTDGYNSQTGENSSLSAGKIVFIGIVCMLLITGIIIVAVKSRYNGGDDNNSIINNDKD